MQNEYHVEKEIVNGKKMECDVFYQPSPPNRITAAAHIQNSVEFIYVKHGTYSAFINQNKYTLFSGDLLFILSRDIHSLRAQDCKENGYYVFKIDPTILYDQSNSSPYKYIIPFKLNKENKKCLWRKNELENSEMLKALNNVISSKSKDIYAGDLIVKINCMNLLLCVLREWNNSGLCDDENITDLSTLVFKSLEYMQKNYMHDITAMDCAREVGLSYSYFSRQFHKIIGKSFREYLNMLRCNEAEKLLLTTDKSITDIAFECGYNDLCYFISVFKSMRGSSPSKYKRELLSDKNIID